MTDIRSTDRDTWAGALDQLTLDHKDEHATIEVVDAEAGYETEAQRLPFAYLDYDPKDDVVIVAVGGATRAFPVVLRHIVSHPVEVDVAVDGGLRIVAEDGAVTLVTFFGDAER
jgi:hypothetical protein